MVALPKGSATDQLPSAAVVATTGEPASGVTTTETPPMPPPSGSSTRPETVANGAYAKFCVSDCPELGVTSTPSGATWWSTAVTATIVASPNTQARYSPSAF